GLDHSLQRFFFLRPPPFLPPFFLPPLSSPSSAASSPPPDALSLGAADGVSAALVAAAGAAPASPGVGAAAPGAGGGGAADGGGGEAEAVAEPAPELPLLPQPAAKTSEAAINTDNVVLIVMRLLRRDQSVPLVAHRTSSTAGFATNRA